MRKSLPSFRKPPVIETVLGLEFTPLDAWLISHFGLFFGDNSPDFAKFEAKGELPPSIESFTEQTTKLVPQVQLVEAPDIRGWYLSEDDREIIQIQKDRFIFNWRKGESELPYPRYDEYLKPRFIERYSAFTSFLSKHHIEAPKVQQCEVTYVNHIPKGEGWQSPDDWRRVFTVFGQSSERKFLPKSEGGNFTMTYLLPEQRGRLRVTVANVVRLKDGIEVLQFNVSARVKPKGSDIDEIIRSFDMGREWVVQGFADLTTYQMHQLWEQLP